MLNTSEVEAAKRDPLNAALVEIVSDAKALLKKVQAIDWRAHDEEQPGEECLTCARLGAFNKASVLNDLVGLEWGLNAIALENFVIAGQQKVLSWVVHFNER